MHSELDARDTEFETDILRVILDKIFGAYGISVDRESKVIS